MDNIKIPAGIYDDMIAHAQSELPIESCGYLGGRQNQVEQFYPMTNVDQSPEHFSFDPKEQFKVLKEARREGQSLMAVYHSHPESPARLSEEDIRLFNDPGMVYIIVSLSDPDVPDMKAYMVAKIDDEVNIRQVTIQKT